MSADFSRAAAHLANALQEHADRDGLRGVKRAVFMDRGGHAPGETCPSAPPPDPHDYWCQWPDDECSCTRVIPPGKGPACTGCPDVLRCHALPRPCNHAGASPTPPTCDTPFDGTPTAPVPPTHTTTTEDQP